MLKKMKKMIEESTRKGRKISGWVLDESKAYRQIGVRPDHRKYSVIAMMDPEKEELAYFVMIGHSFGLTSAVYNYNRRSALLNDIMVDIFKLVAASYYDDKFGFETEETIEEAFEIVKGLHAMLGVWFDLVKCQQKDEMTCWG
jgi:hypothetical protein